MPFSKWDNDLNRYSQKEKYERPIKKRYGIGQYKTGECSNDEKNP